jgi:hypothetical protein
VIAASEVMPLFLAWRRTAVVIIRIIRNKISSGLSIAPIRSIYLASLIITTLFNNKVLAGFENNLWIYVHWVYLIAVWVLAHDDE